MVGKLIVVPLREIWENEAKDFTTWLEKNIDVLNEHLSLDLDDKFVEKPTEEDRNKYFPSLKGRKRKTKKRRKRSKRTKKRFR